MLKNLPIEIGMTYETLCKVLQEYPELIEAAKRPIHIGTIDNLYILNHNSEHPDNMLIIYGDSYEYNELTIYYSDDELIYWENYLEQC